MSTQIGCFPCRDASTFRSALTKVARKYSIQVLLGVAYIAGDPALADLPSISPDQGLPGFGLANIAHPAAVYGDVALVGSPGGGGDFNSSGSVQVYERVQNTNCKDQLCWVYTQTLAPTDLEPANYFGASIAFDGHTALIGSPSAVAGKEAVYVYERQPQGWVVRQKLSSGVTDGPTNFGRRVALRGNVAVVTSLGYGRLGAAYFFDRHEDGMWQLSTSLTPSDVVPDLQFGFCLGLDYQRAIVGGNGGAAYVFRRTGSQWVVEQKFVSSEGGADSFGQSCDIEGDVAVVGAQNARSDSADPNLRGAAYVFDRRAQGWKQYQKVRPTKDQPWTWFGSSVRLLHGVLGVGAAKSPIESGGAVYVFELINGSFTDVLKFAYPEGQETEPQGIVTDGRTLIVSVQDGNRWLWNLLPQ